MIAHPQEHSKEYKTAIASKHWRRLRSLHMHWNEFRCAKCSRYASEAGAALELHHLTYERLGRERPSDAILLCRECHEKADETRASDTQLRNARKLYDAQLDGWASAKHGDNWADDGDPEAIAEAFDRWLRRKE